MKIVWSPLALERAFEIAEYIARDNPAAAGEWVEAVFARVEQLQSYPRSGRKVPETDHEDIREVIFGNYRIIYRVQGRQLAVLTIRHGSQILPEGDIG